MSALSNSLGFTYMLANSRCNLLEPHSSASQPADFLHKVFASELEYTGRHMFTLSANAVSDSQNVCVQSQTYS